jgi:hypothetical protein
MHRKWILGIAFIIGLLLIGGGIWGCGEGTPSIFTIPQASSNLDSPVKFFPVQKAEFEGQAYPAALLTGTLVLENGYLRLYPEIRTNDNPENATIIWPPGSVLNIENEIVKVQISRGASVAKLRDKLKIGGGYIPINIVTKYIGQVLPADCPGKYWLAAPGIVVTPSSTISTISPTPTPITETPAVAFEDEPLRLQATIYAQRFGVPLEEALRRVKMTGESPGVEHILEANEPETFAGLWSLGSSEKGLVVAFTRDGEETLKKYSIYLTGKTAAFIQVRTVQYSLVELRQARDEMMTSLKINNILFVLAGTNVFENSTDITILESDRVRTEAAVQNGIIKIPECVRIKYSKSAGSSL